MNIYDDLKEAYALTASVIKNDINDLLDSINTDQAIYEMFEDINSLKDCIKTLHITKCVEKDDDSRYKLASVLALYFYNSDPYSYEFSEHISTVFDVYRWLIRRDSEMLKPVIDELATYQADGDEEAGELIKEIKKYIKEA